MWGLHSPGYVFHIDCIIVIVIDMEIIRTSRFFYRPRLLVRDPQKLRRRQEKKRIDPTTLLLVGKRQLIHNTCIWIFSSTLMTKWRGGESGNRPLLHLIISSIHFGNIHFSHTPIFLVRFHPHIYRSNLSISLYFLLLDKRCYPTHQSFVRRRPLPFVVQWPPRVRFPLLYYCRGEKQFLATFSECEKCPFLHVSNHSLTQYPPFFSSYNNIPPHSTLHFQHFPHTPLPHNNIN